MTQQPHKHFRHAAVPILFLLNMCLTDSWSHEADAQNPITETELQSDLSLGTTVTHAGNNTFITGGTHAGPNLFHSFDTFGINPKGIAQFINTGTIPDNSTDLLPITDIFARVVGGQESQIHGTIQTTGFGSANFWLMNPSGITFGPGAKLDIGGSATFTTATSLSFGEEDSFVTDPSLGNVQNLSIASVIEFGFFTTEVFTTAPRPIEVTGSNLAVLPGRTLALVGGDITISGGHLQAPDGRIRITTVSGQDGTILRDPDTGSHSYGSGNGENIPPTSPGTVTLSQAPFGKDAVIDTGSSGQIQLNRAIYNGTNDVGLNPTESTTPIIVIQDGSFLVTNLPPTKLVVSSSSVTPPFPTNNDTSTPSLSNPSAVATAARPSPHQLVMASNRCSSSEKGAFSSFVPPSRDTARPQPGGLLASPPYLEDEIPHVSERAIQPTIRATGSLNLAPGAIAFLPRSGTC